MLASTKVLLLLAGIRCIYGAVKMEGELRMLNLNCSILCVSFLGGLFRALGQVYEKSGEVLLLHSTGNGDKWLRRFHRSCRPLRVEIAGLYFVDPAMSLTMGSFVAENVGNLLILAA